MCGVYTRASLPLGRDGREGNRGAEHFSYVSSKIKKARLACLAVYGEFMHYQVLKVNSETAEEFDFGLHSDFADVLAITRGYRYNGIFFTRKGCKWFYIVLTITK